jgi:RimJ/RimL family protein N-acetyltransferase
LAAHLLWEQGVGGSNPPSPTKPHQRGPRTRQDPPVLTFRPLAGTDLDDLRRWLNTPHVYEWWGVSSGPGSLGGTGADAATADQVRDKYVPDLTNDAATTHRHVIEADGRAVGLIQYYRLEDEPEYAAAIGETAPGAAGIDLFIGAVDAIGQGLGANALDAYVNTVVFADPRVTRATAGPHPDNRRSCRAFEKAGFVAVRDVVVPGSGAERIYVRPRD